MTSPLLLIKAEKVKFADEENQKYPLDTKEHVKEAIRHFSDPKNHLQYDPDRRQEVALKIYDAATEHGIKGTTSEPYDDKSEEKSTEVSDTDDDD